MALTVSAIPQQATRLVAVIDGGGLATALRASQNIAAGIGTATMSVGVPVGGPYRVRVIAFIANGTFPAVLRSGKITGVSVAAGAGTGVSVTLEDVTGALDPATPTSGNAGAPLNIRVDITDPGDFLDGVTAGRLWSSTTPFTHNLYGSQTEGSITAIGAGEYQFSITTNLPTAAGTLYYQVGEASYAFDSPDGQEAPFLVWPNLESGAPLQQIAVSITTTSLSAFCRDNTDRR